MHWIGKYSNISQMSFFAPLTIFGINIFGLFQKKNPHSVLDTVSSLQTFKTLALDAGANEQLTQEAEFALLTQQLAQHIGEEQILKMSEHVLSQKNVQDVVSVTLLPDTQKKEATLSDLEGILEVPRSVFDFISYN